MSTYDATVVERRLQAELRRLADGLADLRSRQERILERVDRLETDQAAKDEDDGRESVRVWNEFTAVRERLTALESRPALSPAAATMAEHAVPIGGKPWSLTMARPGVWDTRQPEPPQDAPAGPTPGQETGGEQNASSGQPEAATGYDTNVRAERKVPRYPDPPLGCTVVEFDGPIYVPVSKDIQIETIDFGTPVTFGQDHAYPPQPTQEPTRNPSPSSAAGAERAAGVEPEARREAGAVVGDEALALARGLFYANGTIESDAQRIRDFAARELERVAANERPYVKINPAFSQSFRLGAFHVCEILEQRAAELRGKR